MGKYDFLNLYFQNSMQLHASLNTFIVQVLVILMICATAESYQSFHIAALRYEELLFS